jgi:hypothetical protein
VRCNSVAVRAGKTRSPTRPIPGFNSCVGVSGRIGQGISNSVGISGQKGGFVGRIGLVHAGSEKISVGSGGCTNFDPMSARCNGPNTYLYFKQQKTRYICFKHGNLAQMYHELPSEPLCSGPNSTITSPTQFARYMNRAGSLTGRVGPPNFRPTRANWSDFLAQLADSRSDRAEHEVATLFFDRDIGQVMS